MSSPARIVVILLLGIGASALVAVLVQHFAIAPAKAREEAFAALLSGRLKPEPGGVVALPPQYAAASMDGKMYVTSRPNEPVWALFLKERGAGARLQGYAFCNQPAKAAMTAVVDLNYPVPAGPDGKPPARERVEARVTRVLSPICFEVVHEKPWTMAP